jgi:hypothetical protein
VLGLPGLRFEVGKFNWIGRISSDVLVAFTWHTNKVKTIADAKHYVDLMPGRRIFFRKPRHEHEWEVWEKVKLPSGKLIMPGVVSHCIALVEYPELVTQRVIRYANVVGTQLRAMTAASQHRRYLMKFIRMSPGRSSRRSPRAR